MDDSTHLTINIQDVITDNPFTAQSQYVPVCHAGEAFTFIVEFSEGPSINHLTLRDHAFTVTGGEVTGARRVKRGNNALWQIRVQPVSGDPVIVVLPQATDCGAEGAICTRDGRMLSSRLELTVFVPASQQIANAPATGVPGIGGIPLRGETLAADTSGIADEDGLADTVFSYQWIRHDPESATDMDIEGAAGRSYTVAPEDEGKALKVRVSFTDDWDNEESLTSNAVIAAPLVVIPDQEVTPPLTASVRDAPESHDGESAFTFQLHFSEDFSISDETLRDDAFTVSGGNMTQARQLEAPSNIRWEITVEPSGDGDVAIVLPITTDCEAQGAVCTGDGRMLSNRVELTFAGPEPASADAMLSGLSLSGIDLSPAFASGAHAYTAGVANDVAETTVAPTTSDDGASYAIRLDGMVDPDGQVPLAEGSNVITVEVTAEDGNSVQEYTVTVTRAKARLTASVHDALKSHDGENAFTFELHFSENFGISYKTLRDHAFTVSGGAVTGARRLDPPGNVRWEITVRPDSDAAMTIVLPVTKDCEAGGAICTGDGRKLSNRLELIVSGPGG